MKKILSLLLALTMCLSLVSVAALADGEAETDETAVEEVAETEEPVEAEESTETEEPVVTEEPAETEKPVEAEEPAEAEAPVEAEKLSEAAAVSVEASNADTTASGTCGDNLTWTLDSDGSLTISGIGNMTDWTSESDVPWYDYCSSITTVVIGSSVTSIGKYAFYRCESLTGVTIPNSVTSIGYYAFRYCTSLTGVTIPDSVTSIGNGVFSGCTSLMSVRISDSVTSIGTATFAHCTSLTSVTIPDSVTSIGDTAFMNCTSLTSVTIPDGVTTIGKSAFQECTGLMSVTIPTSMTTIGFHAFCECTSLTSITIPDNVMTIESFAFLRCESLKSITIPDSVTTIGIQAFQNCKSLTNVYYGGSETDWAAISIEEGNAYLTNATIHYNSTGTDTGTDNAEYYTIQSRTTNYEKDDVAEEITYKWGLAMFEQDPTVYSHDMALVSALICGNAYDENKIQSFLTEELLLDNYNYTKDYSDNGVAQPAMAFASKEYELDNITKTVVAVTIRGTQSDSDIITDVVDGSLKSFDLSGQYAYETFWGYCYLYGIDLTDENTIVYITGHSLGGAIAGRLAIELKQNGCNAKTFVYTFAPAKYDTEGYTASDFPYIHNIINTGDPVPSVPPYGDHVGNNWYYVMLYDINGIKSIAGLNVYFHPINKYLSNVLQCAPSSASEIASEIGLLPAYVILKVYCPVNVKIYNSDGVLLGYTEGETAVNPESYEILVLTDGDKKYIYLPVENDYSIEFVGTGEGTMEYAVQSYDACGQVIEEKIFENVVLENGKQFVSEVSEEIEPEDVQLYVIDEDKNVTDKVMEDGEEVPVTEAALGDVTGDGVINVNDVMLLFQYANKQTSALAYASAADVTGDGVINVNDVMRLFQYANKQITSL